MHSRETQRVPGSHSGNRQNWSASTGSRRERRPVQVITPVNSTHRFVLQAIEKGTLQNLVFDNQAFANHRAMAAVFGTILKLPPLKQALASKQFKSIYLDKLLSMQKKKME